MQTYQISRHGQFSMYDGVIDIAGPDVILNIHIKIFNCNNVIGLGNYEDKVRMFRSLHNSLSTSALCSTCRSNCLK